MNSTSFLRRFVSRSTSSAVGAVVTHHTDGFRSGVARFNELLAEHLGVPLYSLDDAGAGWVTSLLSFKASELGETERDALTARLERDGWAGEVYLHEWTDTALERAIVARASRVHCGNLEIQEQVRSLAPNAHAVWTPGLIRDRRSYPHAEVRVFSFGMAHKIRTDEFRRLRDLLDACGRSYAVYVSAANHETQSLQDAQAVFEEMHEVFPDLYFLGNLSDVAVHNQLERSTFFAAFFQRGVRANNTTVAAAMETGAVVITNLDEYSPREYVHMENVIDIEQCTELPSDETTLQRIRDNALATARDRGWDALLERLRA